MIQPIAHITSVRRESLVGGAVVNEALLSHVQYDKSGGPLIADLCIDVTHSPVPQCRWPIIVGRVTLLRVFVYGDDRP